MPLTSRSPHIDAMVDRAKAGEVIELFPRAYLADDQGVRSMRQVYEYRPSRLKRESLAALARRRRHVARLRGRRAQRLHRHVRGRALWAGGTFRGGSGTLSSRTYFVARTAAGVAIETFAERAQALAWIEARGDLFPGWSVASVTEQTVVSTRVLRRDRSCEGAAA